MYMLVDVSLLQNMIKQGLVSQFYRKNTHPKYPQFDLLEKADKYSIKADTL